MIRAPATQFWNPVTPISTLLYSASGEIRSTENVRDAGDRLNEDQRKQGVEGFDTPGITEAVKSQLALTLLAALPASGFTNIGQTSFTDIGSPVSNLTPFLDFDPSGISETVGRTFQGWANSGSMGVQMVAKAYGAPTVGSYQGIKHVSFDRNQSQYLSIESPIPMQWMNTAGASFSVVVVAQFTSNGNYERIFDFGNGPGMDNTLLCREGTQGKVLFQVGNGSDLSMHQAWSQDLYFHTYVMNVVNSESGCTMTVTIDHPSNVMDTATFPTAIRNRTTNVNYIGRSNWSQDAFFSGNIRKLAWFNRSLSTDEIASFMTELTPSAPVPLLDFDASVATSDGPLGKWPNTGSWSEVTFATASSLPPVSGTAGSLRQINFDQSQSQYYNIGFPLQITWLNGSTGGFTCIVVAQYLSSPQNYERFFDFGNGPANNNILWCRQGTSNTGYAEVFNGGTSICRCLIDLPTDQRFHTYMMVYTNTSNGSQVDVYLDNMLTPAGTTTSGTQILNRTITNNYIARSNWNQDSYMSGNIRELMFFDHALSSAEGSVVKANLDTKWGVGG